jgi:L-ascorbate metabolism protein UlaG (beta-lactamase superfamily)
MVRESGVSQPNPSTWMAPDQLTITYVGGPTALLEFGGVRLLTDPTFDPGGGEYRSGPVTLRKLTGPALSLEALGSGDVKPLV